MVLKLPKALSVMQVKSQYSHLFAVEQGLWEFETKVHLQIFAFYEVGHQVPGKGSHDSQLGAVINNYCLI